MQRFDQAPAANAKCDFLHQPHLAPAAIQFAGDAAIDRTVYQVVTVQQIKPFRPTVTRHTRSCSVRPGNSTGICNQPPSLVRAGSIGMLDGSL